MFATLRNWLRLPSPVVQAEPRPRLWLYPFEIVVLVLAGAIVAMIVVAGLRLGMVSVAYTVAPMVRQAPKFLGLGLALQLIYRVLTRQSLRVYLGTVLSGAWLVLWVRIFIATMSWNFAYQWLKVYVPLLNSRLFDEQLWAIDSALHLGISPSVFVATALTGSPALPLLDTWYSFWIVTIQGAICFFAADLRAGVRRGFSLSCAMLWLTGALVYCSVPALGPVFVSGELWESLRPELSGAAASQAGLVLNYQKLLFIRETGVWVSFNPMRGIAAMPSLHVGAHVLFALWAWRVERPLRALWIGATLLTFLGSLATGWHYAIDGYVGGLLALLGSWLAWRLEPLGPASSALAPQSAPPPEQASQIPVDGDPAAAVDLEGAESAAPSPIATSVHSSTRSS